MSGAASAAVKSPIQQQQVENESNSSQASSTPKFDNRGNNNSIQDLVTGPGSEADKLQHPILLDTIETKGPTAFVKKRSNNRRVVPMMGADTQDKQSGQAPAPAPAEKTTVGSITPPPAPSILRKEGSRHHRHRRVRSHEHAPEQQRQQHQLQQQSYGGYQQHHSFDPYVMALGGYPPPPPQGYIPTPPAPDTMRMPPRGRPDPMYLPRVSLPNSDDPQSRRPGHERVHSLPNDPRFLSLFFPAPAMSPYGYPEGQYQYYSGQPQFGGYPAAGQQQQQQQPYPGEQTRRRSSSFSGGLEESGSYGSFDDAGSYSSLPNQPKAPISSSGFSPRNEIRNLTSGFAPTSSPRMGSVPYGGRSPRGMASAAARRQQFDRSQSERGTSSFAGMDPRARSQSERNVSFSPMIDPVTRRGFGQTPPFFQLQDERMRANSEEIVTPDGGFYAQRQHRRSASGSSGRSPGFTSSRRKMHMRQQSAQLFMADIKGKEQPRRCRNVLFALLFVFHWIGIMYLGTTYARDAIMINRADSEETVNLWYRNIIFLASLCGFFAVGVSTLALVLMNFIARRVVQVALFATIGMSFAWGTIGIGLSAKNFVPITGVIALMLSVGYTFVVWDRVPFASANLHAALNAIRDNAGTVLVAFGFQFLALVWSIYYTFVVVGVYNAVENRDLELSQGMTKFVYGSLIVSYYWTFQVLLNVVQVTVAGTIGGWWFKPDGQSSFCDEAVRKAFLSAVFFEFGSICFGSLFVGPARLIRQLSAFFRPSQEDGVLLCLHEFLSCIQNCVSGCVDSLTDRFNPWALTYVGLYGYGFLEAGHNATALFEKRGWSTIVTDDLVPNVLLMFSLVIGGVTGVFGTLIEELDTLDFSTLDRPFLTAFVIGCYMGVVITSVLFGIISSSVNAVLILFAGSPFEFEKNHPDLSTEMRDAWREVWPGCMDEIDLRIEAGLVHASNRRLPQENSPLLYQSSTSM